MPIGHPRHPNRQSVIFSGASWSQRPTWKRLAYVLPKNSYLLVIDANNQQQTQIMRQVARYLRDKGQQVLIWLDPTPEVSRSATETTT